MTQGKPHLELLQGGRRDSDPDEWRAFCRHIGWQALHEPSLPDDYEEQLVARIFAGEGGKVVRMQTARESRRQLRWLALAIVAGVGAALFAWYRAETPPTADTIPSPVPEVTQRPIAPPPERPLPSPQRTAPDPGTRHARLAPAPRRAAPAETPAEPAPEKPALESISPDATPGALHSSQLPPQLVAVMADPEREYAVSRGAARVPRRHLAMATREAAGTRAVALVDVFEAAKQLSEQL
ncbi:MAG TPA: hypothetical protein VFB62_18570 [Polyangiaceae bacterium]|nr:hypothetical protein [Polyangiaceae bacterium]